jgi:hypothetical protein
MYCFFSPEADRDGLVDEVASTTDSAVRHSFSFLTIAVKPYSRKDDADGERKQPRPQSRPSGRDKPKPGLSAQCQVAVPGAVRVRCRTSEMPPLAIAMAATHIHSQPTIVPPPQAPDSFTAAK